MKKVDMLQAMLSSLGGAPVVGNGGVAASFFDGPRGIESIGKVGAARSKDGTHASARRAALKASRRKAARIAARRNRHA